MDVRWVGIAASLAAALLALGWCLIGEFLSNASFEKQRLPSKWHLFSGVCATAGVLCSASLIGKAPASGIGSVVCRVFHGASIPVSLGFAVASPWIMTRGPLLFPRTFHAWLGISAALACLGYGVVKLVALAFCAASNRDLPLSLIGPPHRTFGKGVCLAVTGCALLGFAEKQVVLLRHGSALDFAASNFCALLVALSACCCAVTLSRDKRNLGTPTALDKPESVSAAVPEP